MREGEFKMTDDLGGFEAKLAALVPADVDCVRDRMMFEAGRRSAIHKVRVWRGVATVMAASFALLLVLPHLSGPARIRHDEGNEPAIEMVQASQRPELASIRAATSVGQSGYLNVRGRVLEQGLQALPAGTLSRPTTARPGRTFDADWADAS